LTFTYRSIIVSFIILLSLVAVARGELKISVYTGDAGGCSGYSEYLGAKTNDLIQESTTLAGSCLSQSFKGSGNKAETFSITNRARDHAEVGFGIKIAKAILAATRYLQERPCLSRPLKNWMLIQQI
jgi:hypothetical protein